MDESLTEQRRVSEEGLRVVKLCCQGRTGRRVTALAMTVPEKKAPANYVPAAAVIRRAQALSGITGRKELRRWHSKQIVKACGSTA